MSTTPIPMHHFDRGKPFYPLIMNYLLLLGSVKDIGLQGALNEIVNDFPDNDLVQIRPAKGLQYGLSPKLLDAIGPLSPDMTIAEIFDKHETQINQMSGKKLKLGTRLNDIEKGIAKLMGPLQLKRSDGDPIEVPTDIVAKELVDNLLYLFSFTMRSSGFLLILAYETTRHYHEKAPLWEFLRHCRNAAAHNGRFHLLNNEPRQPAEWGNFRILASMHGQPLFRIDQQTPGFLEPGDVIQLLCDIEQAYPHMQASI